MQLWNRFKFKNSGGLISRIMKTKLIGGGGGGEREKLESSFCWYVMPYSLASLVEVYGSSGAVDCLNLRGRVKNLGKKMEEAPSSEV
jgi:hypothetical protein